MPLRLRQPFPFRVYEILRAGAWRSYVPPGWDTWRALVGNSKYYGYEVSDNGSPVPVRHGHDYGTDYYTDVLKNQSVAWLKSWNQSKPFFMMIGTPCPHVPNEFAPQYAGLFRNVRAPRLPNWNVAPANETGPGAKHWFLRKIGPMDAQHVNNSDMTFQDRWRCLQSVDDMVEEVVGTLRAAGHLNNTYITYSGDHGQHLGEFGMGFDKRQLYETDIRVPLLVRGPGIEAGQAVSQLASHVDLAVTFLDMMGAERPEQMDGTSWLPVVKGTAAERDQVAKRWRHDLLIEYGGPSVPSARSLAGARAAAGSAAEHEALIFRRGLGAAATPTSSPADCGLPVPGHDVHTDCAGIGMCGGEHGRCPCDASNNTYKCVRTLNSTENSIYCEFDDSEDFVEYYDINADPYELHNIASSAESQTAAVRDKMAALRARLRSFMRCWGADCFDPPLNPPLPPAPPPPPPSPVPSGSSVFRRGDRCLTCAEGSCTTSNHVPLVMQGCASPGFADTQAWRVVREGVPSNGALNLQSAVTGGLCVNLNDGAGACGKTAQSYFHMYNCDTTKSQRHVGDHIFWNATLGALQMAPDVCQGPQAMCLVADGANVRLGACMGDGASGWKQIVTP